MRTLHRTLVTSIAAVSLLVAACGDSEETPAEPTAAPTTATTAPAATTLAPPSPASPAPTTRGPEPAPVTSAPPPATTTSPATTPPPPTAAPPTIPSGPLRISVDVYEGQVAGDTEVVIERGTEIEIVVTADVSDEVHVHGYDQKADVSPGSPAVITFVANLPGIYDVELEGSGQHIIHLEIR